MFNLLLASILIAQTPPTITTKQAYEAGTLFGRTTCEAITKGAKTTTEVSKYLAKKYTDKQDRIEGEIGRIYSEFGRNHYLYQAWEFTQNQELDKCRKGYDRLK